MSLTTVSPIDSIAHKPHIDASDLIGWHYGHTTGTSVKGINFLTTLYCTDEVSLLLTFALVEKDEAFTDEKPGKPKRRASVSKNEHYCIKQGDAPGLRQEPDAVPLRPHPNKASTTCGSRRQIT